MPSTKVISALTDATPAAAAAAGKPADSPILFSAATYAGREEAPACRTIELTAGGLVVARVMYHLTAPPLATLQVLDLWVAEAHRRKKVATRLWELALADGRKLLGPAKLRRVYAGVGHKSHVPMRAFLTHQGCHHVATTPQLYRGEDLLTYIKSYT